MEANSGMGTDIHPHGTMPSAGVIRPIENWSTEDVWDYLLDSEWSNGNPNPFYEVNQRLAHLYRDAASGECPVIHDPTQQTCAGSRFGCWTCTVVEVDSSLREMIASGRDDYATEELLELADFRDKLQRERNDPKFRVQGRNRKGRVLVKRDGSVGVGPYTMEYRKHLLEELMKLDDRVSEELISPQEILQIHMIWAEEQADLAELSELKLKVNDQ